MSIFFRNTKTFGLITTTILACASAFFVFHQLRPHVATAQAQIELSLEVSSPKRNHLQLEPSVLNLKLSNRTGSPITWDGIPRVGSRDINILTRLPNGAEFRWNGDKGNNDGFAGPEVTRPNESKETQNLVDGDLFTRIFPQPGSYLLTMEFLYDDFSSGQRQRHYISIWP